LSLRNIYYAVFSAITGIIAGWVLNIFRNDMLFAIGLTLLTSSIIWMIFLGEKIGSIENEISEIENKFMIN